MAQDVSPTFAERWSKRIQVMREPEAIYKVIANSEEVANLRDGDVVHRPYANKLYARTLPSTGAISRQAVTITDSYLTVDQKKEVTFFAQQYEEIQASIPWTDKLATNAGEVLINAVDGAVLGEVTNATSAVGEYEMSGSGSAADGIGFTASVNNVAKIFSTANRKLNRLNIPRKGRWAVISGELESVLDDYLAGRETPNGDEVGKNGSMGQTFRGFKLYSSNALAYTAYYALTNVPGEGETMVINGVTLTWNATMAATEGSLNIEDSVAHHIDNLKAFLEAPDTAITEAAGGGAVAFTTIAYLKALSNIEVTDGTTYATIKVLGKGYVAITETLTYGSFTATKSIQHNVFGQGAPIDLVVQKYPKIEVQPRSGYIGRDFTTWELYGKKTFAEGADQLVDVMILTGSF